MRTLAVWLYRCLNIRIKIENRRDTEFLSYVVSVIGLLLTIPIANAQTPGFDACVTSPECGIFIESQTVTEGTQRGNAFTIRINFEQVTSFESLEPVFIDWNTFPGGPQPASLDDYFDNRDLPIALLSDEHAGRDTVITRFVGIRDDSKIEVDETFLMRLFSSQSALIKRNDAVFTIVDNDASPSLPRISMITDSVMEGDRAAIIRLTLDRPSTSDVRVGFATSPGSAQPGLDYFGTAAGVTFEPGETNARISIGIIDDDEPEQSPENFRVRIRQPLNAAIVFNNQVAEVLITDDDEGVSYADVPSNHWAYNEIKRFAEAGIAGECATAPSKFCPTALLRNDVMALWVLNALEGADFQPPAPTGNRFSDVSTTTWAAGWMENIAVRGITHGCNDYQRFCPTRPMTRAALAYTLVRARHGADFVPAPPSGEYDDVPTTHWAAAYVEQLKRDGVLIGGCQADSRKYCPAARVTRAWAAWMTVRTFGL